MADHAISDHPAVQAALDRLALRSPGADVLGLERITALLDRLGNPHQAVPPVFHVAGTNGKGSTCAFLRAALEADGRAVHVYSSPHLCRFNERIRLAGTLIDDDTLAARLNDVLDVAEGLNASFFEVTTAAAFLAFAGTPADALVLEVGLGGRLDATNVIERPAVCGIAALGLDHQAFLGDTITQIAAEKAGIARTGVPLVTQRYPTNVATVVAATAERTSASLHSRGDAWDIAAYQGKLHFRDERGRIELPTPRLTGAHQHSNLGLAVAMLRAQSILPVSEAALKAAPLWAQWPARLQRLDRGPLLEPLSAPVPVLLDGGHNPQAGEAIAAHLADTLASGEQIDLIIGMLSNKDLGGFLEPLRRYLRAIHSLPVPGHPDHPAEVYAALAADWGLKHEHHTGLSEAIHAIATDPPGTLLIAGSLYLAGCVLKANDQLPI
jgi:dihydrofolate synthase / folylpolyglutamate synthase